MALDNLIPEVLSTNVQVALENSHVAVRLSNRSYQGEIRTAGDRVKVNMIADPTISGYTKNSTTLTYENLSASQRELIVDQSKSFSFRLDDVDMAQVNTNPLFPSLNRAGYGLAQTADAYLLGLYAQAGISLNSSATPIDLTSLNIEEQLTKLGRKFNDAGVPLQMRGLIIAPWVIEKMILAGLTTKTANDVLWANGFVDRILGFDIFMSQNVSKASVTNDLWVDTRNLAVVINESLAFAEQINSVETLRIEGNFGTGVRGLHLYGGKIMRPDKTIVWYADETAEA